MANRGLYLILFHTFLCVCYIEGGKQCPSSWTLRMGKCYKDSRSLTTFMEGKSDCEGVGGTLWIPESQLENDMFEDGSLDSFWIGVYHEDGEWRTADNQPWDPSTSYNRLSHSDLSNLPHEKICVRRDSYNNWYTNGCSNWQRVVCVKSPTCMNGFFGPNCTQRCHCAHSTCDSRTGACESGCQSGWGGPTCSTVVTKAEGMFYCLNTPSEQGKMTLRVNLNNVTYRGMTAVDRGGNSITTCGEQAFKRDNGIVYITVEKVGNEFSPDCGAETVSEDTKTWRFRFSEYPAISTQNDVTFEVTCNFSDADSLQRSSGFSLDQQRHQAVEHLQESHLDVEFKVTEPNSETPVTSVNLGQEIQLTVDFHPNETFGAKTIAPYSCEAKTLDGSASITFVEFNGCEGENTPIKLRRVSMPRGTGTRYQSEVFEAFSFPGHDQIIFTCRIEMCFRLRDLKCYGRCGNSFMFEDLLTRPQKKRQIAPLLNQRKSAGAVLSVRQ